MRSRILLAALTAVATLSPAAVAGTGKSSWCTGGAVVLTNPVTVAVKTMSGSGGANDKVWICYSTTPPGTPGAGGLLVLDVWHRTDPAGAFVAVECYPDGAGAECYVPNNAVVNPDDVGADVEFGPSCVVYTGGDCHVHLPENVVVTVNGEPATPLLSITVLGIPVKVESPLPCVSLTAACAS